MSEYNTPVMYSDYSGYAACFDSAASSTDGSSSCVGPIGGSRDTITNLWGLIEVEHGYLEGTELENWLIDEYLTVSLQVVGVALKIVATELLTQGFGTALAYLAVMQGVGKLLVRITAMQRAHEALRAETGIYVTRKVISDVPITLWKYDSRAKGDVFIS